MHTHYRIRPLNIALNIEHIAIFSVFWGLVALFGVLQTTM